MSTLNNRTKTYCAFFNDTQLKNNTNLNTKLSIAEKRLKYLLLTCENIVLPIEHLLNSPVATEIILKYPNLIKEKIVALSIRDSVNDIDHLFNDDKEVCLRVYRDDIIDLLRNLDIELQYFSIEKTEGIIKKFMKSELSNRNSLLSDWFSGNYDLVQLIDNANIGHLPFRLTQFEKTLDHDKVLKLRGYYDLLYYLAGAAEFRCDCYIPESNIFPLIDWISQKNKISDEAIFADILLLIIAKIKGIHISKYFIEKVTTEEIIKFRKESEFFPQFCKKFHEIKKQTISEITLKDPMLLINQLEIIINQREEIENNYTKLVRKAIRINEKTDKIGKIADFAMNTYSLADPFVGIISGFFQLSKSTLQFTPHKKTIDNKLNKLKNKINKNSIIIDYLTEFFEFQSRKLPQIVDST